MKQIILSVSMDRKNDEWLEEYNERLEKLYGFKIGISKIINILLYMARDKDIGTQMDDNLKRDKVTNAKMKAFNRYVKTVGSIETILLKGKRK